MKSPSLSSEKLHSTKEETWFNMVNLSPFLLSSLAVTSIFGFLILSSPNPFKFSPKHASNQQIPLFEHQNGDDNCDLFKGQWVPDMNGSLCTQIWIAKQSLTLRIASRMEGERDFVNWRWKPQQCEPARFDPKAFLQIVRGKKMAFIGDSVARNHVESLLCLLSKAEVPKDTYKDCEDRFRTWHFPRYNFTLMILWSKFLVTNVEFSHLSPSPSPVGVYKKCPCDGETLELSKTL